jgi:ketosteroid isomerase-like protein
MSSRASVWSDTDETTATTRKEHCRQTRSVRLNAALRDTARAMSQENVEVVRRGFETFNARDLDRHVEFFDPEVEWQTSAEDADAAIHRGLQALKRYLDQWIESLDGMHADVEEYIDVGDDRVFTWSRFTGLGRTSGAPADWYLATIFTMRDGKVVHGEEYFDRAEALEAVGLSEQDAHADS